MEDQKQQFVYLVDQNKALIYKFCYMYANQTDTPQDLFQEVVINLWKGFPGFRGDSKIQTWLYRRCAEYLCHFSAQIGISSKDATIDTGFAGVC